MELFLALTQPTQVNKIITSCEFCNGPHDTQYCMEDLEQAFVNMHPRKPTRREVGKDETKEEGNVNTSTTKYEDHEMTVESEEEFGEETKDEIEEEDEDSPKHFDTFPTMKGLRPTKETRSIRRIQRIPIRPYSSKECDILEDIKRGPYSKKHPIRRIKELSMRRYYEEVPLSLKNDMPP
ncbi:hypothetical protein Tco_0172589 [Tanacetum coccineum]